MCLMAFFSDFLSLLFIWETHIKRVTNHGRVTLTVLGPACQIHCLNTHFPPVFLTNSKPTVHLLLFLSPQIVFNS